VRKELALMLAYLAPYRPDALQLLAKWCTNPQMASQRVKWLTAYIDSASRLEPSAREQAFARLRTTTAKVYDEVKPIKYPPLEPFILKSKGELAAMTAVAFGDAASLATLPGQSTQQVDPPVVNLSEGLGVNY